MAIAPSVLFANSKRISNWYKSKQDFSFFCEIADKDEIPQDVFEKFIKLANGNIRKITENLKPYTMYFENVYLDAQITLGSAPEIAPDGEIKVKIDLASKCYFEDECRPLELRWILPEGFTAIGKRNVKLPGFNPHSDGTGSTEFTIKAGETVEISNRCILEITSPGRHTPLYCSFVLLG